MIVYCGIDSYNTKFHEDTTKMRKGKYIQCITPPYFVYFMEKSFIVKSSQLPPQFFHQPFGCQKQYQQRQEPTVID